MHTMANCKQPIIVIAAVLLFQLAATTDMCSENELEVCEAESVGSLSKNGSVWQKYLDLISSAMRERSNWHIVGEGCDHLTPVISADLAVWRGRGGVKREEFEAARTQRPTGVVHYQVVNHTLYRQTGCMFEPRCRGIEHFILSVLEDIPDLDLLINVMDYPQSAKHKPALPIMSFSRTSFYNDVMYPAWSFWSGGPAIPSEPQGLGRWDLKRQAIAKAADNWPWERKAAMGFFRGSRTSAERDPLVLLSRAKPELVDAAYTKNQAWRSDKDTLGVPAVDIVTLEEHCKYKYLFNFRGVAASFRLKHLFLCRSLVFHVGSEWLEFFYPSLVPWVHYIPVQQDLSDAEELVEFAMYNDEIAHSIAKRGFEFVWNGLGMQHVECYWRSLLLEYSELVMWSVELDRSFLKISV